MDELIQKISALVRQGNEQFQNQQTIQYGVLGGYLLIWLLFTGSLTETIMVAIAMGLGWMVGQRNPRGMD
mgnify:CR=1 FL=1